MVRVESVGDRRRLVLAVREGQRYSCRQCGWCCRWWRVEVTPGERDRLLAHDWPRESSRLRGLKLFDEQAAPGRGEPVIQAAQVGGQCVFLEEDGLCLIHKVLGPDAKPAGCRRFPVRLGLSPEGILMAADYACTAVVYNEGAFFLELEKAVHDELASGAGPGGLGTSMDSPEQLEPLLAPGIPMTWAAYVRLEKSVLGLLGLVDSPITARLAAAGELISTMAVEWSGRGRVDEDGARQWLAREMSGHPVGYQNIALSEGSVLRPASRLAPLIGNVETPHSLRSGTGSTAIGYAMAVARGNGWLGLSTLNATVDLGAAGRVACDMDAARFDDYLSRFLGNYVMRKSLLESPNLKEGWEYLTICLSLVRWYARVSAAISGREEAGEDDLVTGIQVVEKAYVP